MFVYVFCQNDSNTCTVLKKQDTHPNNAHTKQTIETIAKYK